MRAGSGVRALVSKELTLSPRKAVSTDPSGCVSVSLLRGLLNCPAMRAMRLGENNTTRKGSAKDVDTSKLRR
jgi:hypothetical protein